MTKHPTTPAPLVRRHYIDGPFGQIHARCHGAGTPLVLLHQAPMTSAQFDHVYAPLAKHGIMAVGIDMPGFGGSDPTPDVPIIGDYAQIIPAVLTAFGLERAALLGHHTGALVAAEAAVRFPDMASALILNGPLLVDEALKADFLSGLHIWERNWHAREHAGHMAELFDIRDTLAHGEISAERLSDYVVQALSGRGAFWWGHHAAFTYDLSARLPQIACPTLILTNTGDQIHDHALRTKALCPDFSLISLDGGGIDIVDEQPDRWTEAVARFLTEKGNDL